MPGREVVQVVDSIAPAAAVLLDLNSGVAGMWFLRAGAAPDFSPPPLRRSVAQSMLVDGALLSSTAYDNRTIVLPLRLAATGTLASGTWDPVKQGALASLGQRFDQALALLRWQPRSASTPTYYRVLRSPSFDIVRWSPTDGVLDVDVELLAEPFGLGHQVTLGSTTGPDNANPFFETTATNWTGINGATVARSTAQFHEGAASLLITPDGTTAAPRAQSEAIAAVPGRFYQVAGWLRSPATPTVGLTIRWYSDGAGTAFISSSGALAAIAANTWTSYTVTAAAPATAQSYRIAPEYSGTPAGSSTLFGDELTGRATGAYQVTNDPAAAVQGCLLDVTGVAGDVETPAFLQLDPLGGATFAPVISTRRRGTPSADIQPYTQAESMTFGTDTASQSGLGAFSGGQGARVTFATSSALVTRLTASVPYVPGFPRAGARGTYRLWLALAPSNNTTAYELRFTVLSFLGGAQTLAQGDTVSFAPTSTTRRLIDLGLLQLPIGADPAGSGYGPAPTIQAVSVQLQIRRVSGAGTLDVDYLASLPADTEYARIGATASALTLDGPQDMIYMINTGNASLASDNYPIASRVGTLPMLTPGSQTNRIYLLRPQDAGSVGWTGLDDITNTLAVTASYWPRYLVAAP